MDLEGVTVKIGRREFIVPPITMWAEEQCRELGERAAAAQPNAEDFKGDDPAFAVAARKAIDASRDSIIGQVLALLEPNYPELTAAEMKRLLPANQGRLRAVLAQVGAAAAAGIEVVKPGEAVSP